MFSITKSSFRSNTASISGCWCVKYYLGKLKNTWWWARSDYAWVQKVSLTEGSAFLSSVWNNEDFFEGKKNVITGVQYYSAEYFTLHPQKKCPGLICCIVYLSCQCARNKTTVLFHHTSCGYTICSTKTTDWTRPNHTVAQSKNELDCLTPSYHSFKHALFPKLS